MAKTEHDMLNDADLESFFQAARDDAPVPSQDLMARIMADAQAEMPAARPLAPEQPKPGLLATLVAAIGGWPALAGMATATVAGVWIGFAQPDTLSTLAGGVLMPATETSTGYALEDLVPSYNSFDTLLTEEG